MAWVLTLPAASIVLAGALFIAFQASVLKARGARPMRTRNAGETSHWRRPHVAERTQ